MNSNYSSSGNAVSGVATLLMLVVTLAIYVGIFLIWAIMMAATIGICIVCIASTWVIFKKAGMQGWESIVPWYNNWVMADLFTGNNVLWFVLCFVPYANIVSIAVMCVGMAKSFGKDTGFQVLSVFFPYVTMPILAFGKSQYLGNPYR